MSINTQKFSLRSSTQLFFTTIAMILLLIIGLSTATFAWFSANSRVGSGAITFEARNTASASIYLGWDIDSLESEISFSAPEEIDPMVPLAEPVVGVTTPDAFYNSFYSASVTPVGPLGEPSVFNENGFRVIPYKANQAPPDAVALQDYFYIINGSADPTNVMMQVIFEGVNAPLLRVALFTNERYVGTIRPYETDPMAATHFGPIIENSLAGTDNFGQIPTELSLTFPIGGNNGVATDYYQRLDLVCWYDGVWLDENFMDTNAQISLIFRSQRGAITTGG